MRLPAALRAAGLAVVGLAAAGPLLAACESTPTAPEPAPTVTVTATETETAAPAEPTAAPAADACDDLQGGEQLAFILVTEPAVGTAVSSGFTFGGCSNVFEAAYQWELRAADGTVLAEGFGAATCGTGCVGTFSAQVPFQVQQAQVGELEVWAASAQDGSKEHVNLLPLLLQP